jgi:hypothetical protein
MFAAFEIANAAKLRLLNSSGLATYLIFRLSHHFHRASVVLKLVRFRRYQGL